MIVNCLDNLGRLAQVFNGFGGVVVLAAVCVILAFFGFQHYNNCSLYILFDTKCFARTFVGFKVSSRTAAYYDAG